MTKKAVKNNFQDKELYPITVALWHFVAEAAASIKNLTSGELKGRNTLHAFLLDKEKISRLNA